MQTQRSVRAGLGRVGLWVGCGWEERRGGVSEAEGSREQTEAAGGAEREGERKKKRGLKFFSFKLIRRGWVVVVVARGTEVAGGGGEKETERKKKYH